jgi:CIC family chloride channel protein
VAWCIALGSGTSGGTLAPILLVSGSFGGLLGALVNHLDPGLHLSPGAVALVAMAATFGAATRATFTAIVFAFELTRDYNAILPIMLAAVVADLVAGAILDHGLMTEKLARRGLNAPLDYEPDYLRAVSVGAAMATEVETLEAGADVGAARRSIEGTRHSAYPLVDEHRCCVGIVSRSDLLAADATDDAPLTRVASTDVVTVTPDDSLLTALERILEEGVEHLPVLDPDRHLVGMCTRTDILRARGRYLDAERAQGGWQAPWLLRRRTPEVS